MKRRKFIQKLGIGGVATLIGTKGLQAAYTPVQQALTKEPFTDLTDEWGLVRSQFLFPDDLTYLNTGGIGVPPLVTINKMNQCTIDEFKNPSAGHDHKQWERLKEKAAAILGADKDELALINSATEGINIILNGLDLSKNDEIITSTHEHPAVNIPLLNMMQRKGIIIKTFEPSRESGEENLNRIKNLMGRKTKLILHAHVTCTTGQVFPVKEIAQMAREQGIIYALDGAQAPGNVAVNLHDIGVDYYAFSTHKWLLAPKRTGILYVKKDKMDALQPTVVGGYSDKAHDMHERTLAYHDTAQRFEYATQNECLYWGFEESIDFINEIGIQNIFNHNTELTEKFYQELQDIEGVESLSPQQMKFRSNILSFKVMGRDYAELNTFLADRKMRVRMVGENKLNAIRVSFHLYNVEQHVDECIMGIKEFIKS